MKNVFLLFRRGANSTYDFIGEDVWGDESLYLNLGYWTGSSMSYDQAAQNLADYLGCSAQLHNAKEVLDAGYGFGDQDMFWAKKYPKLKIKGVNVTQLHVHRARARVEAAGLSDRVDLMQGSATELSFEHNRFDSVVSLEAAFHFVTRKDFLNEAFRVLKPGGRLAVADVIPCKIPGGANLMQKVRMRVLSALLSTPNVNNHSSEEYREQLEKIGFVDIKIESIKANVYKPFFSFVRNQKNNAQFMSRLSPRVRYFYKMISSPSDKILETFDYVIVSACKPEVFA
ncbi:MAG: methyltransferase domain-containing protein [Ectothiorhodospiraceae bacterium]|nr:methyltransferase domain-containing protein [Ectothiorhodospiraceae bacterium]